MRVQIQVLGGFTVAVNGVAVAPGDWRRDRAAVLVKLLALSPHHKMHRERVMDLFWPHADPEVAGAALRKAVHFARKALGQSELLSTSGDTLTLAPGAEVTVDAEVFEAAAVAALRAPTPEACAAAADI